MRNSIIIFAFLFMLTACHNDPVINVTRIIQNETEKDVEIKVYGGDVIMEDYLIPSLSSDTLSDLCAYQRGQLLSCPPSWIIQGYDSA